ncbi:DNA polymerase III subunit delta [Jeotgalibaca sp. A122]|uniref:DNA polymerase III subunit delta n=1 Tax=Jeotgalibaca sp. A122 TaxID=3457322 RepID=UPI003FD4C315
MSYATEIANIKKGQFNPIYLLLGTESYFIEEARAALMEYVVPKEDQELNVGMYNMDEVPLGNALEDAESLPFFGERRLVIIDNPIFLTGEKPKGNLEHDVAWLESYLENPSESTILAIFAPYEKLDNRKKISKLLKKHATTIDVKPLEADASRKFLSQMIANAGYNMDRQTVQFFFERIEDQLSKGVQELEKLFLSARDDKIITKQMVEDLVPRNLEQNIFEIVTYVMKKDAEKAIRIYRDLLLQKEEPIKINAILLGQFRLLIQVFLLSKQGYQQPDMAKVLKIHPYRVKLASQQIRKMDGQKLMQAYLGLVETEEKMKTGDGMKEVQFELFMLKYANT